MNRFAFLLVTIAFLGPACAREFSKEQAATARPAFVEKSRIEITQNANRSLNFKNIGGNKSSGIKVMMPLGGGSQTFGGFDAGTLVVVGGTGLIVDAGFDRAEYKIQCTYTVPKGTMIEIRTEGMIVPNLEFVRDGKVVADFTVKDSAGKVVMSNKRTTDFLSGKVREVSFEGATKPKEPASAVEKLVDLRAMSFDLKQPIGNGDVINTRLPAPPASAASVRRIRVDGQRQLANLIEGTKVQPVYPPLARSAHIQGSVLFAAIISQQGTVDNLKLIRGHPLLVNAASQAVKQWRFRPSLLNGEPVEVDTTIEVNFVLN